MTEIAFHNSGRRGKVSVYSGLGVSPLTDDGDSLSDFYHNKSFTMYDFTCSQRDHLGSRHGCLKQCAECKAEEEEDENICPECGEGTLTLFGNPLGTRYKFCSHCDYMDHDK